MIISSFQIYPAQPQPRANDPDRAIQTRQHQRQKLHRFLLAKNHRMENRDVELKDEESGEVEVLYVDREEGEDVG